MPNEILLIFVRKINNMRVLASLALVFCLVSFFNLYSQTILTQPDRTLFFYNQYDNLIEIINDCSFDSTTIKGHDAEIKFIGGENYRKYTIRPKFGRSVQLVASKYKNGNLSESDTLIYPVKVFPSPTLLTYTLSKNGGMLYVGFPNGVDIVGERFTVFSYECGGIKGEGNIIPSQALKNYKIGDIVGIKLFIKNSKGELTELLSTVTLVE